jgi:hypothetical protein
MIDEDLIASVRPMVAVTRGNILMTSTPRGSRGAFWQTFTTPSNGWLKLSVTADQCPRIPKEFLEQEKQQGEWYYKQEYMCVFVGNAEMLFNPDDIDEAFDDTLATHDFKGVFRW